MGDLLTQSGLQISSSKLSLLWIYHNLLREANPLLNLTRIHNFENMVRKHYIDSLLVAEILRTNNISLPDCLIDIGSGPGLPGIPLAICLPNIRFILAESRQLRGDFLQKVVDTLGLKNVRVQVGSVSQAHCPEISGAITRALEKMSTTLRRLVLGLEVSGLVIFMKGPRCTDEIQEVSNFNMPYKLILDHHYCLPHSQDQRRLVVWQRLESSILLTDPNSKPYSTNDETIPHEIIEKLHKISGAVWVKSSDNKRFKLAHSLRYSRHVKKNNQSLICGKKLVTEFLKKFPGRCRGLFYPESFVKEENLEELQKTDIPITIFSGQLFSEIDFMGTGPPILLIDVFPLPIWEAVEQTLSDKLPGSETVQLPLTLFLPLGNPENLGAILRSCAAFPIVKAIVLLEEASHPYHPRAIRAAAGHCFSLPLYQGPSLTDFLSLCSQKISRHDGDDFLFALDTKGEDIAKVKLPHHMALLMGSEGQGLPTRLPLRRLSIPTAEAIDSLNASVSLAIALYVLSHRF